MYFYLTYNIKLDSWITTERKYFITYTPTFFASNGNFYFYYYRHRNPLYLCKAVRTYGIHLVIRVGFEDAVTGRHRQVGMSSAIFRIEPHSHYSGRTRKLSNSFPSTNGTSVTLSLNPREFEGPKSRKIKKSKKKNLRHLPRAEEPDTEIRRRCRRAWRSGGS